MKKISTVLSIVLVLVFLFSGCSGAQSDNKSDKTLNPDGYNYSDYGPRSPGETDASETGGANSTSKNDPTGGATGSAKATEQEQSGTHGSKTTQSSSNTSGQNQHTTSAATSKATSKATAKSTSSSTATVNGFTGKNRAVILIPGILGSSIYASKGMTVQTKIGTSYSIPIAADSRLWAPAFDNVWSIVGKVEALGVSNGANTRGEAPIVNKKGTASRNGIRGDREATYGALDTYLDFYNSLYDAFYSADCDVVLFNYNWLKEPSETATELDSFINGKGYKKVAIVGHSMGGIVASQYFALGETQRQKIYSFISLGTPFLGSVNASLILGGCYNAADLGNFLGEYGDLAQLLGLTSSNVNIRGLALKIQSVYSLLPSKHLFKPYLSYNLSGDSTVSTCNTFEGTMNILSKYSGNTWNSVLSDKAVSASDNLMKDGKPITEYVKSYYVAGIGYDTVSKMKITLSDESMNIISAIADGFEDGDSTVSKYSASFGGKVNSKKVFFKIKSQSDGFDSSHVSLGNGSDAKTVQFVVDLIKGNVNENTAAANLKKYGIQK